MSNLRHRVERLEGVNLSETFVCAFVPRDGAEVDRENEIRGLVEAKGHRGPFSFLILDVEEVTEPAVLFIGDADDFFGHIANYGRFVHETDEMHRERVGEVPKTWKGNRA